MVDAVGPHLSQQQDQRVQIAQIALMKPDPRQNFLDVSKRAAPADEAVNFNLGKRRKEVFRKMAANHPRYSGDQHLHVSSKSYSEIRVSRCDTNGIL